MIIKIRTHLTLIEGHANVYIYICCIIIEIENEFPNYIGYVIYTVFFNISAHYI